MSNSKIKTALSVATAAFISCSSSTTSAATKLRERQNGRTGIRPRAKPYRKKAGKANRHQFKVEAGKRRSTGARKPINKPGNRLKSIRKRTPTRSK